MRLGGRRPWRTGQAPSERRVWRTGVLGAVVMLLCVGAIDLLVLAPFLPADESSHAAYALEVADGRLPRLEDNVRPELPGQRPVRIFLANHPPLYHAIAGPILELGVESGHPVAAIRVVRAISLLLAAGTVVVTALLAGLVVKQRRTEMSVLAAALAASVPTFLSTSAMMHNDLLAVFSAAVAYTAAVACLVQGPRRSFIVAIGLGAAVTMATRLNGLAIVALACGALALSYVLYRGGPVLRRLLRGSLAAAIPVVAVIATSGWFYLRNLRIYGDISGVRHNRELGANGDAHTPLGWLTDRLTLPDLLTRAVGGGPWGKAEFFGWYDRKVLGGVLVVIAIGAGMVVTRWVRGLRGVPLLQGTGDETVAARLGRGAAIAVVLVLPVLLLLQLAAYVSQTGSPNPRYLFPGVPAVAVVVAACCLAFRRRAGVLIGLFVVGFQVYLALTTLGRWINIRTGVPRVSPMRQLHDSLVAADIPAPWVVLYGLIVGAGAGICLVTWALWQASGRGATPDGAAAPVTLEHGDGEPAAPASDDPDGSAPRLPRTVVIANDGVSSVGPAS